MFTASHDAIAITGTSVNLLADGSLHSENSPAGLIYPNTRCFIEAFSLRMFASRDQRYIRIWIFYV